MTTIFECSAQTCFDLALAIEEMAPGAYYYGSVINNTEEEYSNIDWRDERPQPTWEEISQCLITTNYYYVLRKNVFMYRLVTLGIIDDFLGIINHSDNSRTKALFEVSNWIESDHPLTQKLRQLVEEIPNITEETVEEIFALDRGDYAEKQRCHPDRYSGCPFSITIEDLDKN
jgi:hypothetical protein